MPMKRLFLLVGLVTLSLVAGSSNALAEMITGAANLHQHNGSGVSGRMEYVDTGSTLTVSGMAEGLTPGQVYISLFYDNGSKPSGPVACEPSARNDITFAQMFIGGWSVKSDGTGTLHAVKMGPSYVPLDKVHSQSIRHVVHFPPMSSADAPVVACGEVHDVA
jgi:hypothetical protein